MARILRLCTWNIQLGLQIGRVLKEIQDYKDFHGLDLLALQETSVHETREGAELVARALGPTYTCYQVQADSFAGHPQGNALVWNTASVHMGYQESLTLPRRDEIALPRLERTFLRSMPLQRRISLILEGTFGTESLRLYVAHLDVLGLQHKREQFGYIIRDAQARPSVDLAIVAGDMNTFKIRSRPSWLDLFAVAENAGFADVTTRIPWTHAVRRLRFRQKLDAIFVKRRRPFDCRSWTLETRGSDHIPVFADLTLS